MLAVHQPMDALQRSTSFGQDAPSLLRQPSAEDLDAAHQLVSSARGERSVVATPPVSQGGDFAAINRPPPSPLTAMSTGDRTSQEPADEPQTFGQVCRYVDG